MGKKTSSEDFMNLLDDQETSGKAMAFDPAKKRTSSERKFKTTGPKPAMKIGTYQLGPVQQELVEFVINRTPTFVTKWATSDEAKHLMERVGHSYSRVKHVWRGIRKQR